MQEESDQPVPPPPVRFPGDGLPPIEIFPACKPDEPSVQALSPEENQRVNESLRRAILRHQEQQSTEPEQTKLDKFSNRKPRSSAPSSRSSINKDTVFNTCIGLALLMAFGSSAFLSPPYILWVSSFGLMLLSGCIAYAVSMRSHKVFPELLKDAIIACLVLSGLCGMTYGSEVRDDVGGYVSEGFQTSFEEKSGHAVRAFAVLSIGAIAGLFLADRQRQLKRSEQ